MSESKAGASLRGAWVIAGKDIRSLFHSPLFYTIAGICSLVWSIMFINAIREFSERSMMSAFQHGEGQGPNLNFEVFARHISLVNFLMMLAVGALTMRSFADEKRQRTFDLLLTAPVTSTEITLGKFFGGLVCAWGLTLLSMVYPLLVAPVASFDWGPLLSSFLGLFLIVGCYVAIGTMTSSFTTHPVLAVIFALIGNVMLWFTGNFFEGGEGPFWTAVKEQVNVGTHFVNFLKGGIPLSSVVFFVSVMFICVFITQRVVESHRWS